MIMWWWISFISFWAILSQYILHFFSLSIHDWIRNVVAINHCGRGQRMFIWRESKRSIEVYATAWVSQNPHICMIVANCTQSENSNRLNILLLWCPVTTTARSDYISDDCFINAHKYKSESNLVKSRLRSLLAIL